MAVARLEPRVVLLILAMWAGIGLNGKAGEESAARSKSWGYLLIEVRLGRASFDLPAQGPGGKALVIVSALSRGAGPFVLRLHARSGAEGAVASESVRAVPASFHHQTRALAVDLTAPPTEPPKPSGFPARERTFQLMVRDGDATSASNYLPVQGLLRGVGERIQVYVDARDSDAVAAATVADIVTTFDQEVYPTAVRLWGPARDTDGDGRLTVLVTGWLAHLGNGRLAVDGSFRGADLDDRVSPPFGNQTDMIYLNAGLGAGPYLKTVLAHEYAHAVTFSRKVLGDDGVRGPEEEAWLDEAIAHLAEDLHGYSRTNIDDRVSAFLARPEAFSLVVADYYAANLFRSQGHRGSTYSFLRWCADGVGIEQLTSALMRSRLSGAANLEAAMGRPFAELFRLWTVRLYEPALNGREAPGFGLPRATYVAADGPDETWSAPGTSCHFVIVGTDENKTTHVDVSGPPESELQVTAVPLPPGSARLSLIAQPATRPDGSPAARLIVRECDGADVRLEWLTWAPLGPGPTATEKHELDRAALAHLFPSNELRAHSQATSSLIDLPCTGSVTARVVFHLAARDKEGRRVEAYADLASRSE